MNDVLKRMSMNYGEKKYWAYYVHNYESHYTPSFDRKSDLLWWMDNLYESEKPDEYRICLNYATFRGMKLRLMYYYRRGWFISSHLRIDDHKIIGRRASVC